MTDIDAIANRTAAGIGLAYRSGEAGPVAVTECLLGRIGKAKGENVFIAVTTDLVPEDLRSLTAIERLAADGVKVTLAFGEKKTLDLRTAAPASVSAAQMLFRGVTQPASFRR